MNEDPYLVDFVRRKNFYLYKMCRYAERCAASEYGSECPADPDYCARRQVMDRLSELSKLEVIVDKESRVKK